MSWIFGKKGGENKSELPELPSLPYPNTKERRIKNELPPLPSLPFTSIIDERIENASVKEIVQEEQGLEPVTEEIENLEKFQKPRIVQPTIQMAKEPVFIRIDNYQNSIKNFTDVKKKLLEIENMLKNIKEIKSREDAELHGWEQEIQEAKAKLDRIDRLIFQKIEE